MSRLRTAKIRRKAAVAVAMAVMLPYSAVVSGADKSISVRDVAEVSVFFPIYGYAIDSTYSTNSQQLHQLRELLSAYPSGVKALEVDSVYVSGYASPDGNLDRNRQLAMRRMDAMRAWLVDECGVPSESITLGNGIVPWDELRAMLAARPFDGSGKVLEIIGHGSDDNVTDNNRRINRLKQIDGGRIWNVLCEDYLPALRRACVVTVKWRESNVEQPELCPEPVCPDTVAVSPLPAQVSEMVAATPCERRRWSVRTSVPAWAAAVANVAVEYGFGCRWSVGVDLGYSAWNYGSDTRKFRTFRFRPEVRYWFSDGHKGLFVEGHAAMMSYNVALPDWEYRIQDRDGDHPALGGGIGAGYRLPLGRSGHWAVEGAIGLGVYHLDYDRFVNEPDGRLIDSRSRVFAGIDNVALSIVYTF